MLVRKLKNVVAVLLVFGLLVCGSQNAQARSGGFTHPEIGELIEFGFDPDMPFFTIYGFTQYRIIDPSTQYRGIHANFTDPFDSRSISLDESLDLLFKSLDGKGSEPAPLLFEYSGFLKQFSDKLLTLPLQEQIKAVRALGGFDGPEGYIALNDLNAFGDLDVSALASAHMDYTITIEGQEYPYRLLMFYVEEDDWENIYFERYGYINMNGNWKLLRLTKEYASEYLERIQYIHGSQGTPQEALVRAEEELLGGTHWNMTPSEVSTTLKGRLENNEIKIADQYLFRIPVSAAFKFDQEALCSVEYSFADAQSYFAAFVSLYIRFYDPITVDLAGDMTWSLPSVLITLHYDEVQPTLTIENREEVSEAVG